MRSSPSRPDPLDSGPIGFAHRGLNSGREIPENSMAAFEAAIAIGAGIECDLRLTADDHLVIFHDEDATRICGQPHRISRSSLADLATLRVGGGRIPTLDSLLQVVDGRVPLLLEIKVNRDVRRLTVALDHALASYTGPYGVMSFDPRLVRQVRARMPSARRGLVIRDSLTAIERALAVRVAAPAFLAVDRLSLGNAWVARARQRMPVYSWTITSAAERAQAEVHADALIWEGDGRPRI